MRLCSASLPAAPDASTNHAALAPLYSFELHHVQLPSLTCADSATHDLVHTVDPGDLIGRLWQPWDQLRVKSGASEISRREASGSEDIRVTKEEQEDEEPTIEEEDGRKTEPTGAGVPRRKLGDSWPGEPAPTPPRFRRSVASPEREKKKKKDGKQYRSKKRRTQRNRQEGSLAGEPEERQHRRKEVRQSEDSGDRDKESEREKGKTRTVKP
ncbi:hypothetical protein NDU88_005498 [Pleurodeles waltl]|uniref:Uncharacterized protein n=1 Tax=Pleurodeles waltl TaxID=8319 RepID=A0AAV7RL67_PLEWA|nr:hypothetical protein NDU88_005498 [Pleurodeles waltl]